MSDWSSYLCASDLTKACRGCNPDLRRAGLRARRLLIFDCREKPRQRIAEAASRPGDAESRPWMACGGESDMDVCRTGEHLPAGTPLIPKPAYGPSAKVSTIPQNKCRRPCRAGGRSWNLASHIRGVSWPSG